METGRKSRSLVALANKIVARCPEFVAANEVILLNVNDLRNFFHFKSNSRIYDVLGILESLLLVTKTCPENYNWNGFGHLQKTMALFKMIAEKLNFADDIKQAKTLEAQLLLNKNYEILPQSLAVSQPEVSKPANIPVQGQKSGSSHKLELAQRLIMLSIVNPPGETLSLSTCQIAIFNDSEDRRLRDILNVLSCIPHPVITQISASYNYRRKKHIYYSGPDVANISLSLDEIYSLPDYRRKSMISVGLNALDIPERQRSLPGLVSIFLVCSMQNNDADDVLDDAGDVLDDAGDVLDANDVLDDADDVHDANDVLDDAGDVLDDADDVLDDAGDVLDDPGNVHDDADIVLVANDVLDDADDVHDANDVLDDADDVHDANDVLDDADVLDAGDVLDADASIAAT